MLQYKINRAYELIVVSIAALIYLPGLISPPALMDDVDAAEALQAKNMLLSGDWVTQHLNGTLYIDKAPLKYWITASLYSVFGFHDWVARLPTALAAIALCWLVFRIGSWTASAEAGFYSGLVLATSIGLFLFTRTVIPDVILTLLIAFSLWCVFRAIETEQSSFRWAMAAWTAVALAVLTKGLIGAFFPVVISATYLLLVGKSKWRNLHPFIGLALFFVIAAPWHLLASIRNPPVLDFTLHAGERFGGHFRGFFWFYFINEQLLRFLNERWPRDYNTVPRVWFWLYHLLWFFPWTFCLPAIRRLSFTTVDKTGRMRVLLLCWIGVIMVFFTLSTTQEYYSMPIYPAAALLIGSAMTFGSKWLRMVSITSIAIAALLLFILVRVWSLPTPGDIFTALSQHPALYTLSLGHMADLTLSAFAYLRLPLGIAAAALLLGGLLANRYGYIAIALMMVGFFQAARLALVTFDPYLSSFAVARELNTLPQGTVIICGKYNPLSSVFFYSRDKAVQNNGELDILEYGSLAPGAPKLTVSDGEMKTMWDSANQVYVIAKSNKMAHVRSVIGAQKVRFRSGDKYLLANH